MGKHGSSKLHYFPLSLNLEIWASTSLSFTDIFDSIKQRLLFFESISRFWICTLSIHLIRWKHAEKDSHWISRLFSGQGNQKSAYISYSGFTFFRRPYYTTITEPMIDLLHNKKHWNFWRGRLGIRHKLSSRINSIANFCIWDFACN